MRPWTLLLVVPVLLGACGAPAASGEPAPPALMTPAPTTAQSTPVPATGSPTARATDIASLEPTANPDQAEGTWVNAGSLAPPLELVSAGQTRAGAILVFGWPPCPDESNEPRGPAHLAIGNLQTGDWRSAGRAPAGSEDAGLVWLSDGRVLMAGDANSTRRETFVYDPVARTWSRSGLLHTARSAPMVALPDGGALIVGGLRKGMSGEAFASVEAWDPRTGKWSSAGKLSEARIDPALVVLSDGRVLAVGGAHAWDPTVASVAADLFDPMTRRWATAAKLPVPLAVTAVVPLVDGGALVFGEDATSDEYGDPIGTSLVFRFDIGAGTWNRTPLTTEPWGVVPLGTGRVLLSGDQMTIYDVASGRKAPLTPPDNDWRSIFPLADGSLLLSASASDSKPDSADPDLEVCVPRQHTQLWRFVPG